VSPATQQTLFEIDRLARGDSSVAERGGLQKLSGSTGVELSGVVSMALTCDLAGKVSIQSKANYKSKFQE
jgi:hypothetical protein